MASMRLELSSQSEKEVLDQFDSILDEIADSIFDKSQENLIKHKAVDTGNLLKTANVFRLPFEKHISYPSPYSDVIEFGRDPGSMPPSSALHKWVRRKLGVSNENDIKRTAFAIAKSIEKKGTKPRPYLRPARDDVIREFEA